MSVDPAADAAAWNERHPVGTPVLFWPMMRAEAGRPSRTRTPAWVIGGHSAVVMVEGYAGGISLTHVDAVDAALLHPDTTRAVLAEVEEERGRQDAKWGQQDHADGTGPAVAWLAPANAAWLRDWARDRCDAEHHAGCGTFASILFEEVAEALAEDDPAALRTELIQVAAVAVSWAEAIDRRAAGRS